MPTNQLQLNEPKLSGFAWSGLEKECFALTGSIRQDKTAAKNFNDTVKNTKEALRPVLSEIRDRLNAQGMRNDCADTPKIGWQAWVKANNAKLGFSLATANRICGDRAPDKPKRPKVVIGDWSVHGVDSRTDLWYIYIHADVEIEEPNPAFKGGKWRGTDEHAQPSDRIIAEVRVESRVYLDANKNEAITKEKYTELEKRFFAQLRSLNLMSPAVKQQLKKYEQDAKEWEDAQAAEKAGYTVQGSRGRWEKSATHGEEVLNRSTGTCRPEQTGTARSNGESDRCLHDVLILSGSEGCAMPDKGTALRQEPIDREERFRVCDRLSALGGNRHFRGQRLQRSRVDNFQQPQNG